MVKFPVHSAKLTAPIIISAALLGGCGTIAALSDPEYRYKPYGRTRVDFLLVAGLDGVVMTFDVPFSLVADTIVLPYTLIADPPAPQVDEQPAESGK